MPLTLRNLSIGLLTASFLAAPATATQPDLFGQWCGTVGDKIAIEPDGVSNLGLSQCDWAKAPSPSARQHSDQITCSFAPLQDGETEVTRPTETFEFEAELLHDNQIEMSFNGGDTTVIFTRCEGS